MNASDYSLNASSPGPSPCAAYTQPEPCVTERFYVNTLLGGVICVIGLLGNSVSFAVLSRDKQTPIAALLLQSLAVADNLFLVTWLVNIATPCLLTYAGVGRWQSAAWTRVHIYTYPLLFVGQTLTIWLTVFIALTRYFAVCRPYIAARVWNATAVRQGVAAIFAFSLAYNLPRFFEFRVTHIRCQAADYFLPSRWLRQSDVFVKIYFDIMYYIFMFGLPFALLSLLNTRLIVAYRAVQRRRDAMLAHRLHAPHTPLNGHHGDKESPDVQHPSSRASQQHREPNITLVMIVVILAFLLCNLPARAVQVAYAYSHAAHAQCRSFRSLAIELSGVLEALNSSCNFAIYCAFRHQFRAILRHSSACCQATTGGQQQQALTTTNARATLTPATQLPQPLTAAQKGDTAASQPNKDTVATVQADAVTMETQPMIQHTDCDL